MDESTTESAPPKKLTRQRAWQLRKKAEGRCTTCGAIRDAAFKDYCAKCQKKHLKRKRARAAKKAEAAAAEPVSYMRYDPEAT